MLIYYQIFMSLIVLNTVDLIDGIQIGAASTTSSTVRDDAECSEDAETTKEPTVDSGSPASDDCSKDMFEDNVPKYTGEQHNAVRK